MSSTLGAARVHTLKLTYPAFGCWEAELVLDAGEAPAVGAVLDLTIGDLVLRGTVLRSGLDAPDRPGVTFGGGAGWERLVTRPLSYQEDSGVRLASVLDDLAEASGETIEQPTDARLGPYYEVIAAHDMDPARYRDALADLARSGVLAPWRIDPDGVTRFGARVGTEVKVRATDLGSKRNAGYTRLGIDDPLPFLPGNIYAGAPIARLVVRESSGQLEADVYAEEPTAAPSLRASVQRMVWPMLQEQLRTYVVDSVEPDKRLNLVPPPDAPYLPEMNNVEQWSLGGALVTPERGAEVLVMFRDRRRTRPIVLGFAPGVPDRVKVDADTEIALGNPATRGVARANDVVTVLLPPATFVGTINGVSTTGMVIWNQGQTMGNITTFSAKVKAE